MRQVLMADLIAATRALANIAPERRAPTMQRWLHEVHAAHLYAKRLGRPHPIWGFGALESRLAQETLSPRPRFHLGDPNVLDALCHVVTAIEQRRRPAILGKPCLAEKAPHVLTYSPIVKGA